MAQSIIVKHKLEDLVLDHRAKGETQDAIAKACNAALARRRPKTTDRVSKSVIKRYVATLDKASVPAAHAPQAAERNVQIAVDFASRLNDLDAALGRWLAEAEKAVTPMRGVLWDPYVQAPVDPKAARDSVDDHDSTLRDVREQMVELYEEAGLTAPDVAFATTVLVPDWNARLGTAREMRQHLEAYASVMDRIHNAEQVKAFQAAVLEAIREADPATANRVTASLRSMQQVRQAAMLGVE